MLLEENKPLAPFTTLGIGGPARWFVEAHSEEDVAEAAAWARAESVSLFVLGGGSNLLVSDAGFNGLVLHIALKGIRLQESNTGSVERLHQVAAGEDWDAFVQRTVDEGYAGVECLAGIPGTAGGTPVQNVGAYGQEVSTSIEQVRVFDLRERSFNTFSNERCGFGYRRSIFNSSQRNRYIVTRVSFRLSSTQAPSLKYADLLREFPAASNPSLKQVADAVRRIRQSKGMLLVDGDPDCRSAGSFFKNPIVNEDQVAQIASAAGAEPPRFPAGREEPAMVKLSAAWLIEEAGFAKGYTVDRAGISQKHTLALVNRNGATAAEIMALADQIRSAVVAQFGIELQMEPVMLGF
jgi:UDP-N-acetylmuramate dehydrogenase